MFLPKCFTQLFYLREHQERFTSMKLNLSSMFCFLHQHFFQDRNCFIYIKFYIVFILFKTIHTIKVATKIS